MRSDTNRPKRIIGWDIGGAHVKGALFEQVGENDITILDAVLIMCRLWEGLNRLDDALETLCTHLGAADCYAVTMTGELADIFPNRAEGVRSILRLSRDHLSRSTPPDHPQPDLMIYGGGCDFLDPLSAYNHPHFVASANWQALGALTGNRVKNCLVMDIGSTTTDIIPLRDGRIRQSGLSDHERLRDAGLVYSGVVRTPLIALTREILFEGNSIPLMAEMFATTADIYRLLECLDPHSDCAPTADGAGKTATDSARRLARMIGLDAAERPLAVWRSLAGQFADIQFTNLRIACQDRIRQEGLHPTDPMIGYGCGQFLIKKIAASLGCPYVGVETLLGISDADLAARIALCGPAVAVAWLAATYSAE